MKKLITLSLLTTSLLFAASIQDTNKEAVDFLQSNNSDKAYELLEGSYVKGDFDNQTLFLLGTSAKQKGDVKNAIKYFEELLEKDKGAHRARLDLATLYYKIQNVEKAKELLLIVKASNPPSKVGDNIDSFLATIEQETPKSWSASIDIGYMYDSNVNAGPKTDTVLIYNLPFNLSNDARENSDYAIRYGAGINHLKQLDGFSWQSSLGANVTDYRKIDTLDSKSIFVSTGPTTRNEDVTYSLPLILNTAIIGHENKYYTISKGISPQVSYQLQPNLSVSAALSLQNKKYYEASEKESNAITLFPSVRYFLDQSSYVSLGGYLGKENSKTETISNQSQGLNLGYYKAFSKDANVFLSGSINSTDYDGVEIAYGKSREDTAKSVSGTFSYFVEAIKSNISLNVSYTKNSSNIEMYDYDRKQIGLNISRNF